MDNTTNTGRYTIIILDNEGVINDDCRIQEYSYDNFIEAVRNYATACCIKSIDRQVVLVNTETNEIIRQFSCKSTKSNVFIR
jgi:hypothetical protein